MTSVGPGSPAKTLTPGGKRGYKDYVRDADEESIFHSERRPSKFLRLTEDAAFDYQLTKWSEKAKNSSSWLWLCPQIHPMFSKRTAGNGYRAQGGERFLSLVPQVHPQYVAPTERKRRPVENIPNAFSHSQSETQNGHHLHGVAHSSPTQRQHPALRPPGDPISFDPVWWWPDVIHKNNFHTESGLLLVGNPENSRAGIMPTYEIFFAMIQAGLARRNADSSYALRNRELDEVQRKYDKMIEDKAKCEEEQKDVDRITSGNYGEYDHDTFEWAMKRHSEVIYRIRALESEEEQLQVQQDDIYARHQAVNVSTMAVEKTLWDLLDDLLVRIGVFPSVDDNDQNPRVRVVHAREPADDPNMDWPENNWNDEIPGEWKPAPFEDKGSEVFGPLEEEEAESTWNNAWKDYPRNDHLLALQDVLYQTAEEAIRVEREFNDVREQYDRELQTYMFHQRGKRDNASVRSYQLEEEFGPIWLEKCRKISAKMQEADRGHAQAECALSDANRHDREVRRRPSKPELRLPGQTEAIEPRRFGKRISSRKRRWIDEWLEDVYMKPGDEDRQKPGEEPAQPITVATDEASRSLRSEDVPMATGHRRRRIDRYVLRSRDLRQDTSNTALQQLHLDWARKVGERM
ncbi:hypothetical protein J4E80_002133 [Alternaria sp. BMP 0032]|nr:hypothetical protein J4E80_002133 [Alternaria sp. BMP 0032]